MAKDIVHELADLDPMAADILHGLAEDIVHELTVNFVHELANLDRMAEDIAHDLAEDTAHELADLDPMAEDIVHELADWHPMAEDYDSVTFNSYGSAQTAAHMPVRSSPPQRQASDNNESVKLYVDGFPADLTESGLKAFLTNIGCSILSAKVVKNKNKSEKPMGFLDLPTVRAAEKAIELIRGQKTMRLFVCFVATEEELCRKDDKMEQEFEQMAAKLYNQNNEKRLRGEISPREEPKVFARYKSHRFRAKDSADM